MRRALLHRVGIFEQQAVEGCACGCAVLPGERWADVPDWPGYRVSTLGRVHGPRVLRRSRHRHDGYESVVLCAPGRVKFRTNIGRVVLAAFWGGWRDDAEASHLNHNPLDNRLENLRWESKSDNNRRKWWRGTQNLPERDELGRWTKE